MTDQPVTEQTLRLALAEFRIDLGKELASHLERKASAKSLTALARRVARLEIWRAGVDAVQGWKRWFLGSVVIAGGVGGLGAIATVIWLAVGT